MQVLPNQNSPLVNRATGNIIPPWNSYLQQFTQKPPPVMAIDVTASPFSYTAVEPGNVAISGGTVSAIVLTRGSVSITIVGSNFVPVAIGDIVTVTYSVLPTIRFIPAYGNAPR